MNLFLTIFILSIAILILFLIAPAYSSKEQQKPFLNKNIAHRGLHSNDHVVPENSLAAFQDAVKAGYGIELDLQLSKDKKLVVFHDDNLKRVCGVDKRVDELTYEELKKLSLSNSNEYIPLFSEVLHLVNGCVPLVVELKNGRNNRLLCETTYELLKNYQGHYCVESFQPMIVAWFRKHAKEVLRGQLSAQMAEFKGELKTYQAFVLSNLLTNVIARPQFVAFHKGQRPLLVSLCYALGAMRVVWTVRPNDDIKNIESKNDTIIFEFYTPDVTFKR